MSLVLARSLRHYAYTLGLLSIMSASSALAASPSDETEAVAQANWRETIASIPASGEGCFMAEYPSTAWMPVGCVEAPNRRFVPRSSTAPISTCPGPLTGNGCDYNLTSATLISKTRGSFPVVTGVTSEIGLLGPNDYSLQLNSNFMPGVGPCAGISGCESWEQFVYSSGETSAFMQYWLIDYGATCPSGWMSSEGTDCYKNSYGITVPQEAITNLQSMALSAHAKSGGQDVLVLTVGTMAYSTSGKDSVVDLATAWNQSEFNIVGDGEGSNATFNTGSSVRVRIATTNGSTSAPTCGGPSNGGTTGETNNLKLGKCTATGGANPTIAFTESN
jgi:hypothetical protein